jgi:hypothetical protein
MPAATAAESRANGSTLALANSEAPKSNLGCLEFGIAARNTVQRVWVGSRAEAPEPATACFTARRLLKQKLVTRILELLLDRG